MDPQAVPAVPADLLAYLEKAFPERSAERNDTIDTLKWRGGERSVVRLLRRVFEEQNNTVTSNPQETLNVPT